MQSHHTLTTPCLHCGQLVTRRLANVKPSGRVFCSPLCHIAERDNLQVTKERFWQRVDCSGGSQACWPWIGTKRYGYGFLKILKKPVRVHRFSWQIHVGPIPDGLHVLHKCNNPACVNPSHLYVGTDQDNMNDKIRAGRQNHPFGSRIANAILNDDIVRSIRARHANGETRTEIARDLGLKRNNVDQVIYRQRWTHI
jgi:hypothetical protein